MDVIAVVEAQEKVPEKPKGLTMPVKKWFRRIQPTPLYAVFTLTVIYFAVSIFISHTTHSLTLLMVSYQMLCNIIAMGGCIITIRHAKKKSLRQEVRDENKSGINSISAQVDQPNETECPESSKNTKTLTETNQTNKMKNTFGWARIDVLVMLMCCVFLASFCFSLLVEALQTLLHIDHQDEMHQPLIVLGLGITSIILNIICYLLIGGYTFHQGSFLFIKETGDVILDTVITTNNVVSSGSRRLSRSRNVPKSLTTHNKQRQGFKEFTRDLFSSILVIITSICTYFANEDVGKFIDPAFSMLSGLVLLILSYPYMKESCLILLQTIPDTFDIESTQTQLLKAFPDILNVHDFHVWQLTTSKVISTVHIIFQNPRVYNKIISDINAFFEDRGVTQLTIQPEFFVTKPQSSTVEDTTLNCLMKCKSELCITNSCCPEYETEKEHKHDCKKRKNAIKKTQSLESVKIESQKLDNKKSVSTTASQDVRMNETAVITEVKDV